MLWISECSPPYYGKNCKQLCTCGPGAISCDSSRGCVCSSSWEGVNCDVDVNECVVTPNICGSDKTCVNTDGGYECNCRSGYQKASTDNSVPCTGKKLLFTSPGLQVHIFRYCHHLLSLSTSVTFYTSIFSWHATWNTYLVG